MTNTPDIRIIARRLPKDLIGRETEFTACREAPGGLFLNSVPGCGITEILKQTFDTHFRSGGVLPFYFCARGDESVSVAARRFLYEFLLAAAAFGRMDRDLLLTRPYAPELVELAMPDDAVWFERLVELYLQEDMGEAEIVRIGLCAPMRARASGRDVVVIVDDLHLSEQFAEELFRNYESSGMRFIFAARKGFEPVIGNCRYQEIAPLGLEDAGKMIEIFSHEYGVAINDSSRDLIAAQFRGNASAIELLFAAAAGNSASLDSFENVGKVYCREMISGSIGRRFEVLLRSAARAGGTSDANILRLLRGIYEEASAVLSIEEWQRMFASTIPRTEAALGPLKINGFIDISSGRVVPIDDDPLLRDHLQNRFRLDLDGENSELFAAELISHQLKRAPKLMAGIYRSAASLNLAQILAAFRGQTIPTALLVYGSFKDEYKGAPDDEIMRDIASADETTALPKVVFTTHIENLYRPIARFVPKEAAAAAVGFREGRVDDEHEIFWLAAEIDSKLEAPPELAEFWCDRLETAALMCSFVSYRIWLIAPEGFSPAALEVLAERGAFGSSRQQARLLKRFLNVDPDRRPAETVDEYEISIPMSGESELISAHAVEEIAKRHNFDSKAINQIKTALVEACINAAEHGQSPDRRIRQKVSVADDRITITVSNRGIRIRDKKQDAHAAVSDRRGWGLKLMETLMDEVTIDEVDDGTSISMTKYLVHDTEEE